MKNGVIILLGALAATASPASAGRWQSVGEWTVAQTELGCLSEKTEYQGRLPSTFRFYKFADGRNAIEIRNLGWSVKSNDKRTLYVLLDDRAFEVKASSPSDHVLLFPIQSDILKLISSAQYVTIFLKLDEKREKPLEQFSLSGSALALENAERCLSELQAKKDQENRRESWISSDPFGAE